jgi:hypothetical protein
VRKRKKPNIMIRTPHTEDSRMLPQTTMPAPLEELALTDFAHRHALPYGLVWHAVLSGRLKARRVGRQWRVDAEAGAAFAKAHRTERAGAVA